MTSHEIFLENLQIFLKYQILPILMHNLKFRQMFISLKSTHPNFLAIYKGFHFSMEQLLAHCAMFLFLLEVYTYNTTHF